MKKVSYVPLKNTLINSFGTFLSRISGIVKFNVVNFLFGASADTFHSANANLLALRKVLGEGPLVSAFLPVFSKEKNEDTIAADKFASNIINQIIIVSCVVIAVGIFVVPMWTRIFLPGFNNDPTAFQEVVGQTSIMLLSTVFFSFFSVAMGLLNAHERFFSSANAPIVANIVFIFFPLATYQYLGITSLAWAVVIGTFLQALMEVIELYIVGFRYSFVLDFTHPTSKKFWKLFGPTSLNYLAQSGISIGLGYFASFLPKGSITYIRNANTIMIAPVGFIGVAISTAIFPIFAKIKDNKKQLAQAWIQGLLFFMFIAIPISLFCSLYPDVIVNLIFRDISLLVTGSTGRMTKELLGLTIKSVQILGTIIIPWSLTVLTSKIFYAIEKPKMPLILILINFITNIAGYKISQIYGWEGIGLVYSDLISGWLTTIIGLTLIAHTLKQQPTDYQSIVIQTLLFTIISGIIWILLKPIHNWYLTTTSPLLLLIIGTTLFITGYLIFGFVSYLLNISPLRNRYNSLPKE
ncbi:MAG: murein biosynthesis integral membrane protein MurJ [Brevinema sp.]